MILSVLGQPVELTFDSTVGTQDQNRIGQTWSRCMLQGEPKGEPLRVEAGVGDGAEAPTSEGRQRISAPSLAVLEQRLAARLTLLGIEARRKDLLMWHAVGVSDDEGNVAILTAPSGTGKTTASRSLGQRLGYVSDETVAVTPEGAVLAYPKPLSVIEQRGDPKVQLGPAALGLHQPVASLRPRFLALLNRVTSGFAEPQVELVPVEDALFELVPQISYLTETPGGLQSVLRMIDLCGGVRRITYQEADTLEACVECGLRSDEDHQTSWTVLDGWEPSVPLADAPVTSASRIGLGREIHDLVQVNGVMIALVRGTLMRLDGIAPTMVSLLFEGPLAFEELREGLIAELGAPETGDVQKLMAEAVEELTNRGLLSRSQ